MGAIENVSLKLAKGLGNKLNKSDEEVEVLNYGLFFIIHTFSAILITFIFGIIFNVLIEIMSISITASLLKRYCGGTHSSTPNRCILSGLILSLLISFISKYMAINISDINLIILELVSLVFSIYFIYLKCPVGSKNKPLKKESTRNKLRKKAFKLMCIYVSSIICMLLIYKINQVYIVKLIIISMTMGIMLQIFAMSKIGDFTINLLEKLFNLINIK
ncbi:MULTISPECIES: accessory gene regulator ArgB-like protein [unclassified Romboutsia]|uniref:accessory gene regulator ArgB-like protein n=1 Tax=unclassified Romboutsia TaxID=2626894 RepID=UPI000822D0C7|nr:MULTISPECIES: accessory gene regulator B family protein [unclassified Romboutsia]SCI04242.1 putative accessory gene regulator protein [uncultured Clostridium sp.]